jgi:hypothetical protein
MQLSFFKIDAIIRLLCHVTEPIIYHNWTLSFEIDSIFSPLDIGLKDIAVRRVLDDRNYRMIFHNGLNDITVRQVLDDKK